MGLALSRSPPPFSALRCFTYSTSSPGAHCSPPGIIFVSIATAAAEL